MPKMNTVKENNISIKLNYLYNLIYQILGMLIPLITTPYVSRILGASQIGEYTYALYRKSTRLNSRHKRPSS